MHKKILSNFVKYTAYLECLYKIIYPSICILCQNNFKSIICIKCYKKIMFLHQINYCRICGCISSLDCCLNCINKDFIKINQIHSIFLYNDNTGSIKKIIYNLKNMKSTYVLKLITHMLLKYLSYIFKKCDILLPVPNSSIKRIRRGYSHTHMITNMLCEKLNIKQHNDILFRKWYDIKDQKKMSQYDRIKNIKKENFYIKNADRLKNKNIIILDDVITTGNTVKKCYEIVNQCGCKNIEIVSFARTIKL